MSPVFLLLLASAEPAAAKPLPTLDELQFEECTALASTDPASAVSEANLWAQQKGGFLAKACHGQALANDFRFAEAVPIFTAAATEATNAGDARAPRWWAQAGNAAIAASLPDQALSALDAALASPALIDTERAECQVDRARALVMLGRDADAAISLTTARQLSPENGTAWLLSATLSRRMNMLPDALSQIQTAASLLPKEPAVPLEAGNIAAAAGDEAAARKQWEQVIQIAPKSRQAETAQIRLAELSPSAEAKPSETRSDETATNPQSR